MDSSMSARGWLTIITLKYDLIVHVPNENVSIMNQSMSVLKTAEGRGLFD